MVPARSGRPWRQPNWPPTRIFSTPACLPQMRSNKHLGIACRTGQVRCVPIVAHLAAHSESGHRRGRHYPEDCEPGARLSVTGSDPSPVRGLPFTVSVTAPGLPSRRLTTCGSVHVIDAPGSRMPWKIVAPPAVVRSAQQASLTTVSKITTSAEAWPAAVCAAGLLAAVAEPDRAREHQDVGGEDLLVEPWPVVRRPAMFGHVRPHAGGDVVVDGAQRVDRHAVGLHDGLAAVDQPLGVAAVRRSLECAVDEQRVKVVISRPQRVRGAGSGHRLSVGERTHVP